MVIRRSLKKNTTPENLSLHDFYTVRNKVLILRQTGGVGDILMQRMMFEGFKRAFPECHLVYSCPLRFRDLMENHPFLDEWIPSEQVKLSDFIQCFNITSPCNHYENTMAPFSDKHRSDIWANHCGVLLDKHDMHLNLSEEDVSFGNRVVNDVNKDDKPSIAFCVTSAMMGKNLQDKQITETVKGLRDRGLFVYSTHTGVIDEFQRTDVPVFTDIPLRKWMGVINAADYVLTVDTAAFHLSGGLKKPTVGVFSFTDGKIYGKYYDFTLVQKHRDDGCWDCGPCYNWTQCTKVKRDIRKPCIVEISPEMILNGVDTMLEKHPFPTIIKS